MTTEQLRKEIMVTNWHVSSKGLTIDYWRSDVKKALFYSSEQSARELNFIGAIDSCQITNLNVWLKYNNVDYTWNQEFINDFKMCQWDALSLVIRHEYDKEVEKQIDKSDLGKAIKKLK